MGRCVAFFSAFALVLVVFETRTFHLFITYFWLRVGHTSSDKIMFIMKEVTSALL